MGLSNYTELQTSIAKWLKRPDLNAQIPDYITLSEKTLNKKIRSRHNHVRMDALLNEEFESLPTNFVGFKDLRFPAYPGRKLFFVEPENFRPRFNPTNETVPRVYTVRGSQMQFWPIPVDVTIEIELFIEIPSLSDAAPTNWLLTNEPSCYLYGALVEAGPALGVGQIDRVNTWSKLLTNAVVGVNDDFFKPTTRMPLRTEIPRLLQQYGSYGFDISTGFFR
jgi:hypothetical protein